MVVEDFRQQRRSGMVAIALAGAVSGTLWLWVDRLLPPLAGMESVAARMLFTLKCWSAAVLFTLSLGIEAVAHERLVSPAFDPLAGFETRRLKVNQRYLQNTLEQTVVFAAALFGLAAYSLDGSQMRAVVASSIVWVLARFAFWIGYHHSSALRGLGAPGMALSLIVLLYVSIRFGGEVAGLGGEIFVAGAFLGLEAVLFWTTRRPCNS
jgi:uncharacterized MAPEG superfamily protein